MCTYCVRKNMHDKFTVVESSKYTNLIRQRVNNPIIITMIKMIQKSRETNIDVIVLTLYVLKYYQIRFTVLF